MRTRGRKLLRVIMLEEYLREKSAQNRQMRTEKRAK
jgi:hypothetical protein